MKRLTIRQILVPIDFSERSIRAITTAKNLAQRLESTVNLINIQQPFLPAMFVGAGGAPIPISSIEAEEALRKSAAQRLQALAKDHRLTGVCDAVIGAPLFNEICMIARQIPVDLIVTSTHGRMGLKHVFLGSTAERLVQHAPCPVLVSRKGRATIDKILVPVDFSRCSLEGLRYAIQFADQFAASLFILNAVYLGEPYTSDGFAMYDLSALEKEARKTAEKQMRRVVRQAKFGRVKFETAIEVGEPVDKITALAKAQGVDLIITATHGWTGFKHVLMGSTAERVVRRAECSVLVVPSHAKVRTRHLLDQTKRSERRTRKIVPGRALKRRLLEAGQLTKKFRRATAHAFPERRQTNKFRESHSSSL